ncbi:hypothetical protein CCZ01_09750 [Helicobacter monodelphidis]|uniref:hypothetical protein n=1 Tax=Helicobacter sp. 15-1451 TaxID=2004995 RepID=UPI000DCD1718|nr:hypothetical protein [Helicobacter sp. 15-1451]RAX56218.1 hypothetical protein CCZ01_09750 [Helicobacter sp. 15-1451]
MQKYPEVYSLEESLAILDKYKDRLNEEQYNAIKSVVCGHAIEDIYANEGDIILLVRKSIYNLSADEILKEYREKGIMEI